MNDRKEHNRNLRMIKPKPMKLKRSWKSNAENNINLRLENMFSKKLQMLMLEFMNI
jgi:hypothetical protein